MSSDVCAVEAPQAAPPARPRRRRLLGWLLVALLLAVAVAGQVVARRASLSAGSSFWPRSGLTRANDGVTDTRYVVQEVPGSGFSVYTTLRNDGRVPITILGVDSDGLLGSWVQRARLAPVDERSGRKAFEAQTTSTSVTVDRGEEVALMLDFRIPRCLYMEKGSYSDHTVLPLKVRILGVTRRLSVPLLDLPVTVAGTSPELPADCAPPS